MLKAGGLESLIGIGAFAISCNAVAHHSGAMFDDKSSVTVAGTVKAFQWTNPHCWIQVLVPGEPFPIEWSIEMGSPSQLFRGGWRPGSLKAGDKIVAIIRPMRDGTHGGLFMSAQRENGQPISSNVELPSAGSP